MNRSVLSITAVAIAAAILAVCLAPAATAAERTIRDAKFDNRAVSKNGRIDITKATREKDGATTRFSVTMRAKVRRSRSKERPGIFLNTKGGTRSDPEYVVFGSTIFRIRKPGDPIAVGDATLTSGRRIWRFAFDAGQVKALDDGYGWAAVTQKGDRVADVAPDDGYVGAK